MNLIDKIKKDKSFRRNIGIVILFIIFMNYKGQSQAVTEEYCNSLAPNGIFSTTTAYNACKGTPGCYVWARNSGNWLLGLDDILACIGKLISTPVMDGCTAGAENGQYIVGVSDVGCKSGYSIEQGHLCGDKMYQCMAAPPGLECEESWQSGFAKLMPFDFARGWGCAGKAYAVIGIAIFAVMMVL